MSPKRSRTLSRAHAMTVVDVRDGVRIANADHADVALAHLARAFELDPELVRAAESAHR